jgi:hypothetical protein
VLNNTLRVSGCVHGCQTRCCLVRRRHGRRRLGQRRARLLDRGAHLDLVAHALPRGAEPRRVPPDALGVHVPQNVLLDQRVDRATNRARRNAHARAARDDGVHLCIRQTRREKNGGNDSGLCGHTNQYCTRKQTKHNGKIRMQIRALRTMTSTSVWQSRMASNSSNAITSNPFSCASSQISAPDAHGGVSNTSRNCSAARATIVCSTSAINTVNMQWMNERMRIQIQ